MLLQLVVAFHHITCPLQDPAFDLVISGINRGDNCGLHVIYSGTVGAAREAACKVDRLLCLECMPANTGKYSCGHNPLQRTLVCMHEKRLTTSWCEMSLERPHQL